VRVVLEFNSVLANRHSGFFTYGAGLLHGFNQLARQMELVLFCSRKFSEHRRWLGPAADRPNIRWRTCPLKFRYLGAWWRHVSVPSLQRFVGEFDVYHCNHHLMPPTARRPRVLTVHDLRRYRLPQFYPRSKLAPFEYALRSADHLIAISQATKRDLADIFGIADERIDVVYHGGPLPRLEATEPAERDHLAAYGLAPGRYFVAFSSYDRRKNIPNTVRAFELARPQLGDDYRLVIIGRLSPDEPAPESPGVITTGPLSSFDALRAGAGAVVFASYYEGFGLPALETMAAGCPLITSNTSSMPEVVGDAALLVEPDQPDAIAQAMIQIAEDEAVRHRLIAAGRKRAAEFSWRRAARETLAVYTKLT